MHQLLWFDSDLKAANKKLQTYKIRINNAIVLKETKKIKAKKKEIIYLVNLETKSVYVVFYFVLDL